MSNRVFIMIAALALAVAALVLLLPKPEPGATPVIREVEAPAVDRTEALSPARRPDTRPIAASRFAGADDLPVQANDYDALRVLVIDETTRLPVPGAEVAWVNIPPDDRWAPWGVRETSSLVGGFDHARNRTVADTRGIALVRTSGYLQIGARKGTSFGIRDFDSAPTGEVRLLIRPGPLIAARVVDASGNPVPGIQVMFAIPRKHGTDARLGVSREPDGLAIVGTPMDTATWEGDVNVFAAAGEVPHVVSAKASLPELEAGPILLVVRPGGRLVVRLKDLEGRLITDEARVQLSASHDRTPKLFFARATAGVATFTSVPVGLPLAVSATVPRFDSIVDREIGVLSGPRELEVELRFERTRCVVSGRAVDELGAPLAHRQFLLDVVTERSWPTLDSPDRGVTDGDGIFALVLDRKLFEAGPADLDFEIERQGRDVPRAGVSHVTAIPDGPEYSLGDVRMPPQRRLISGVVVDHDGKPLANALVTVDHVNITYVERGITVGPGPKLAATERLRARTDSNGTFEIPCPRRLVPRSFSVSAALDGYDLWYAPAALEMGTKDVKVTLLGAGVLEGRLLLPDPAPVRDVELHVSRVEGDRESSNRYEDRVDSDGRFRLQRILPGRVTVTVKLAKGADLAVIRDVDVPRFAAAADPRLRAIDLREHPAQRRPGTESR